MRYLILLAALSGCATLGPMPLATGVSAIPGARPDVSAQVGFMPGFYLSSSVTEEPHGEAIPQLMATIDPGHHLPGLIVGARAFGQSGDTAFEPLVGYRKALGADARLAFAAILYGTRSSASHEHAKYAATRSGLEGSADFRLTKPHRWIELHGTGSLSITNVSADGTYCNDGSAQQVGVDCPDPFPEPPPSQTSAEASGVYPAVTLGLAADLFQHRATAFHGARIGMMLGVGAMPHVVDGEQARATSFVTIGASLTLSLGAP